MLNRARDRRLPHEVLLVEDNPGDIRLLQEAFKECAVDCTLHIARDGELAMAFLRRKGTYAESPRPSLVLLDLNLPRKNGREVLAEIKSEAALRCIPVVVLSTSTNPEDISVAYHLQANCYVVKPEDLNGLIDLSKLLESFWLQTVWLPV
jgi:two-component system, chemotaxis family, response regulator Rcp1